MAFLYTGQGSQYVEHAQAAPRRRADCGRDLCRSRSRDDALLGKPLSEFIFVDQADADAVAKAEEDLRQTEITQPAVLAIDLALTRLLAAYGIQPDYDDGAQPGRIRSAGRVRRAPL